jgi:hypothetical protein
VLLEQWLSSGHGLAFPESPGSASRDRREVAPSGLLLSAGRLHVLAAEIDSRLAPPGTWRRRLCDWAIAHPESGPQRLIKHRVRRLLGFHNLHFIWQATRSAESPTSRPGSLNSNGTSHEPTDSILQVRHLPVVQRRQGDQRALVRRSPRRDLRLIGPNGAGKSSLLNVLNGVYRFDAGDRVRTAPFGASTLEAARRGIGRTFQNNALFKKMSVLDNMLTGLSRHAQQLYRAGPGPAASPP